MSIITSNKEITNGSIVKIANVGGGRVFINDLYIQNFTKEQLIKRFNGSGKYQIVGGVEIEKTQKNSQNI